MTARFGAKRIIRPPEHPVPEAPAGFLSASAAAKRWRRPLRTVSAWCVAGVIPGAILVCCDRCEARLEVRQTCPSNRWFLPRGVRPPCVKRGRPRRGGVGGLRAAKK